MTKLESQKVEVNKSASEIFLFLSDFNNFQKFMPEQVTNWVSTSENCSFTIKGMASLGMKFSEKLPDSVIKIVPEGKVPFDFKLNCMIEASGDKSIIQMTMDADLNPMLKMMAEKPLSNFLNLMVNRIKEI
jgi:carbon monoxide dehydrogenase subunit G